MFQTKYDKMNENTKYVSCSGTEIEITYDYKIDAKTGVRSLVPVGKTNIKEYIQSFKDSVDINKMMERFQAGETDIFNKVNGFYADVTDFPKTMAEMYARVEEANKKFMELPPDMRSLFNNSPSEFWAQFGTDEFNAQFAPDLVEPDVDIDVNVPVEPIVKEDE